MKEVAFHFKVTLQTLLQVPAVTFIYPATLAENASAGLGTECAVSKGFYISFVLAGNLISSFFI